MAPYWHVPKMAALNTLVSEDGSVSIVCAECSKTIVVFATPPTVEAVVKAVKAEGHKHPKPKH